MATIESVTGPVDPADLGTVLIHEHLRFRDNATADEFPHLYDEDALYAAGLEAANGAKGVGVKTIVDPAMDGGRDVRFAQRVAQETGIQVVMHRDLHLRLPAPPLSSRAEDYLADAFVHDIEVGIQGTDVKAAFLKTAADEPGITPNVEKVHRAVARASLRTGRRSWPTRAREPHRPGADARSSSRRASRPSKVKIAHTGDTDDVDYIEEAAGAGPYIGMDRYGIDIFLPDRQRNTTLAALWSAATRSGWSSPWTPARRSTGSTTPPRRP